MKDKTKKIIRQYLMFMIAGGISAFVELFVYSLLVILYVHYLVANVIAYTCSMIVNYFLSMKLVYKGRKDRSRKIEFMIFATLSLVALGLSELCLLFFLHIFVTGNFFRTSAEFQKILAKILAIFVVSVFNFTTRKYFLEEKKSDKKEQDSIL